MNISKSMRQIVTFWICVWLAVIAAVANASEPTSVNTDDALKRLLDGNARFVAGKSDELNGSKLIERRAALTKDQKPFAVIVSCSDSRVPPEFVFNVGLGDIFVIRTAGEVVDTIALGSIEYAVEHLGSSLIVVLGHQQCGAVAAAVSGANETGKIPDVLKAIAPQWRKQKANPGIRLITLFGQTRSISRSTSRARVRFSRRECNLETSKLWPRGMTWILEALSC